MAHAGARAAAAAMLRRACRRRARAAARAMFDAALGDIFTPLL